MKAIISLTIVLIFWSLILSAQQRNELDKEQLAKIAERFLLNREIKFDGIINFSPEDDRIYPDERLFGGIQSLTESTIQNWDGAAWQNFRKDNFRYDVKNNLIEIFGRAWDGANWVNSDLQTCTYTANLLVEWLLQLWYGSYLVNDEKTNYTYNLNNFWEEEINQIWNGSSWINEEKYTYTYDVNNNLIEMLDQLWNISDWENFIHYTFTFDSSNHMVEELIQIWVGSSWSNFFTIKFSYVLNNVSEVILFDWDGFSWVKYAKYTYSYDINNNFIEALRQRWIGSAWINDYKSTYIYDMNNQLLEVLFQDWDGSHWVNNTKVTYTYIPTRVEEDDFQPSTFKLEQNYPNPFNPSTTIRYTIPSSEFVTLKVYDVLGNEVATLVNEEKPAGSYEINFSASNLSSGMYLYTLQAGSYTQTKKLILIK